MNFVVFQHACFQPASNEADHAWIPNSEFDKAEQPFVTKAPEEVLQVRFQHPTHLAARNHFVERRQGSKPELWFTPSFRCYLFESCCHGWLIFSLHRRPNPPVGWSPCFRRTVHLPLAASPCGWLSQPRSTISQADFRQAIGSSSPCRLVGPYKQCLNLTDLPCSYASLWPHAGGSNPGSTPEHSPWRILKFRLPL